ncbi:MULTISPECIES: hypothetical protein [unclassified Nocardia]|uniref:hypothetical protein n=1 Tax=unclassified Nocardia TaxID=2637762 RepID=UPI001CE3EDE1|nr:MULTISPECIES: hypothetical protein [unclassified Nocardia]
MRAVASVYRLGPNQRAVLRCLVDGTPRSVADISARTGKSGRQIRACLPSLLALRYVRPTRPAGWAITAAGVRAATLLRIHWN